MKKTNKKKVPRSIAVGSIIVAITLPASVFASLAPIDLPIDLETISGDTLPASIGGESGLSQAAQEVLLDISPILNETKEIFRSIKAGNIESSFNRILGVLGELGLLNPADESARLGSPGSSENPYSNPQTPEQVYELQRHGDIVRSEIPQRLSQVVFGQQGQKILAQQNQAIQQAVQTSLNSQQGVANTYQKSVRQAQQNVVDAEKVKARGNNAQSANVTQRIMKAIAAQNADLASISSGHSVQLARLAQAASYQSAQLNATNSQLAALNDKAQVLEIFGASQNYQMAQINTAIEHQNHYQQIKDSLETNAAYQSSALIYIPGLVPKDVAP